MRKIFAVLVIVAAVAAAKAAYEKDPMWKAFKLQYEKKYPTPEEEQRRYDIFKKNMEEATDLNNEDDEAEYGWSMFSDMEPSEFLDDGNDMGGFAAEYEEGDLAADDDDMETRASLPESFDWRSKGAVTAVQHQGYFCGSCWAFTAVAVAEGAHYVKNKKLVKLSEQHFVNCFGSCKGNDKSKALEWAKKKGGILPSSLLKYSGVAAKCSVDSKKFVVKIKSVSRLSAKKPDTMRSTLKSRGPLGVSMDFSKLGSYKSGITGDKTGCSKSKTNHAVTVVGWGVDSKTKTKYWIYKNSHGTGWGENGYGRIIRGTNACAIESYPVSAVAK